MQKRYAGRQKARGLVVTARRRTPGKPGRPRLHKQQVGPGGGRRQTEAAGGLQLAQGPSDSPISS